MKTLSLLVVALSAPLMATHVSADQSELPLKDETAKSDSQIHASDSFACQAVKYVPASTQPESVELSKTKKARTVAAHDYSHDLIVVNDDGSIACGIVHQGVWKDKFVYTDGRLSTFSANQLKHDAKALGVSHAKSDKSIRPSYRATLAIDGLDLKWGHKYVYDISFQDVSTSEFKKSMDEFSYDKKGKLVKFERISLSSNR